MTGSRDIGSRSRLALYALIVAATAALLHMGALRYDLVWDDHLLLDQVRQLTGQGGAAALVTADTFAGSHSNRFYRPLVLLSLYADDRIGGGRPAFFHFTSILLHTLACLLLFLLLVSIVGPSWPAAAGALLFAVHPVHVESVAFVSGRTDLIAAVFCLTAALLWHRDERPDRTLLYPAAGTLCYLLALLSKEVAALLPGVFILWWAATPAAPGKRRRLLPWGVGWAAALAVAAVLRFGVAGVPLASGLPHPSGLERLPILLLAAARLLLVPWPLSAFYTPASLAPGPAAIAAAALLAAASAGALRWGRRPASIVAVIWIAAFLLPALGLVPFGGAPIADRFLYLPSAGLAMLVAVLLSEVDRRARRPLLPAAAFLVLAAVLALGTALRLPVWRDDVALFTATAKTSGGLAVIHFNLGTALALRGEHAPAAEAFRRAVDRQPDFVDALVGLGGSLGALGRAEEAVNALRRALDLRPAQPDVLNSLGVQLHALGRYREAAEAYRGGLKLEPDSGTLLFNLGLALVRAGDRDGALECERALRRLDPSLADRLLRSLGSAR